MEFTCRYVKDNGEVIREVVAGQNIEEVRNRLQDKGVLPISVSPKGLSWNLRRGKKKKSFTTQDLIVFNQQFVALIRSGLPIVSSLDLLKERITNDGLKLHVASVRDKVVSGVALSSALEEEGVFSKVYTASIFAGERSGNLEEVINRFIRYERTVLTASKKFRNSLIYPGFLIVLSTVMVGVIMGFVIPRFSDLYEGMRAALPLPTQVLITIAGLIQDSLAPLLILVLVACLAYRIWATSAIGRSWVDLVKLRLPIVGNIWSMFAIAQVCRTLSTLLKGGIPLVSALDVSRDSCGNHAIADAIAVGSASVKEGMSLTQGLTLSERFPDLALEMIRVGEQTGALPDMLNHVADFYDEDVDLRLTALLSWAEPVILIVVAVLVALILVSLYLPIFSVGARGFPV